MGGYRHSGDLVTSSLSAPSWYELRGSDLLLRLRIQPRASREGIDGLHGGRLRIRISSPPVDGAANDRLVRVLAEALGVPRAAIKLARGAKSREKDIVVQGVAARAAELVARLTAAPD